MANNALITGITGQDGSYLAELLLSKGYNVFGLVRRVSTPNTKNIEGIMKDITLIDGDMTDPQSLMSSINISKPDEVYNLAAQSFVKSSFVQPITTSEANALGVVRLIGCLKEKTPDARFYQASTSELYGGLQSVMQNEETPFHPRSPYGYSKLMAFWAVVNARESGMHASNGILFNHESERRGIEFVTRKISSTVAKIKLGLEKEIVLGNMDAKRDWGYSPDYVEAMYLMLQQDKPDDYVIATGETHSIKEFVEEAFKVVGIDDWEKYVRQDPSFMRPTDVNVLCGNPSKAKRVLGWEPKVKFKELVKIMIEHDLKQLGRSNV